MHLVRGASFSQRKMMRSKMGDKVYDSTLDVQARVINKIRIDHRF